MTSTVECPVICPDNSLIVVPIGICIYKNNVEYDEKQQISASKNVSLFFGVKYAGILITSYLSGFLLDYLDKTESKIIYSSYFIFMNFKIKTK